MIQTIKTALANQRIEVYSISEQIAEGQEYYFIKRNLDMRRRRNVRSYTVTVFRDFEEDDVCYRGSSAVTVGDGTSLAELEEKLKAAYFGAQFAKNKWYPIPQGQKEETVDTNPALNKTWDQMGMALAEAAFAADTQPDVFLNSMEIYAEKYTVHTVNSCGVDVSYIRYSLNGEFVAQCPAPQDVETHESFYYDKLDVEAFQNRVKQVLQLTKDRAKATVPAPAGKYRLVLSDKHVATVMSYFLDRSNAAYIYPGYSNYRVGDNVQMAGSEDAVTGDRLNISLTATVPYSREGLCMKDRPLLKDGVLQTIHGASRFCHYLGVEPTGEYRKLTVASGTVSVEEMKSEPYLYVVNFSDFQMDSLAGTFGGEIRLAYWFDGTKVTPVTGGSVNGSIVQAQKTITLSKECQDGTVFCGPLAVCMENVTVAGAGGGE